MENKIVSNTSSDVHQQSQAQLENANTDKLAEKWCWHYRKNKSQSNSIGSGVFIFATGGMNMAWSFGYNIASSYNTTYMLICWFIMAIVGAIFGAAVTKLLKKKTIMLLSAVLVIFAGISAIAFKSNSLAIMLARHLNGFAVGCLFVQFMVMSGEESSKELRGLNTASMDVLGFSMGAYIHFIYTDVTSIVFDVNQMLGVLMIIFGIAAFITAHISLIESPVFYLMHDQEQLAIDSLEKLQKPFMLDELKTYINENEKKSLRQNFIETLPALTKLSIYRGIAAMTFSVTINLAFAITAIASQGTLSWPTSFCYLWRVIAIVACSFLQDTVGRKLPILIGMLSSGGLSIELATLFLNVNNTFDQGKMSIAFILFNLYEFCAGIAITSSSSYLSEAFPLAIKPYCVAFVFTFEMLVHIICITSEHNMYSFSYYLFALGTLSLLFAAFTVCSLPETKKLTLLEAQAKFKIFSSCSDIGIARKSESFNNQKERI